VARERRLHALRHSTHPRKGSGNGPRADVGLMIWDGASPGTYLNVLRLAMIDSPCIL
jgi:hypothetical protein